MENDDYRTVRVYTKKYTSKDKDGNALDNPAKFVKADSYATFETHLE